MLCSAKDIISEREEHCERFREVVNDHFRVVTSSEIFLFIPPLPSLIRSLQGTPAHSWAASREA